MIVTNTYFLSTWTPGLGRKFYKAQVKNNPYFKSLATTFKVVDKVSVAVAVAKAKAAESEAPAVASAIVSSRI